MSDVLHELHDIKRDLEIIKVDLKLIKADLQVIKEYIVKKQLEEMRESKWGFWGLSAS